MAGQLWGSTIPGAQAFLRSFVGPAQPEETLHNASRQTDALAPQEIPSEGLKSNKPVIQDAGVKSVSPSEGSPSTSAIANTIAREGSLQRLGNEATSQLAGLPSSSDLPAWKQKIMDKNEANKKEINGIGDDFTNKAIDRIEKLPEERREKAAEEYLRSTDNIMSGVKKVMNFSAGISRYF